jgi:hypothetical protein
VSGVQIFKITSEAWRASIPAASGRVWRNLATPGVLFAWAGFVIVAPVLLLTLMEALQYPTLEIYGSDFCVALEQHLPFALATILVVVQKGLLLAGLLLTIKIVNRVTDNQQKIYRSAVPNETHAY